MADLQRQLSQAKAENSVLASKLMKTKQETVDVRAARHHFCVDRLTNAGL